MPNPALVFKHPMDGTTILEVVEYRTTPPGGIVAMTETGRQVTIGPNVEYVVEDWLEENGGDHGD